MGELGSTHVEGVTLVAECHRRFMDMVALCTRDLALVRLVGVGHILRRARCELLVRPAVTRQACRCCRRHSHSAGMALSAADVRRNVFVDEEAVPAAWSGGL